MFEQHNKKDQKHLIELITNRSDSAPNFALLLGSGASVTSGIKSGSSLVNDWRKELYKRSDSDLEIDEWLELQEWYNEEEEYSMLFEEVCDEPSHRRIRIENIVEGAIPSWGYIYLSNIIKNKYFNVVFTPNFDDLLNEACYTYAGLKPIVCAHDSAVRGIRVTSSRPKILKLHGDFLYDDIKNTLRETENLEKNMSDKIKQFAKEYGIVVIGYGGYDRSIMDVLNALIKDESNFPNGIYWCAMKDSKPGKKLTKLIRNDRVYYVEIEGFDEFMAELHGALGDPLPDTVRDPYRATTERLNSFVRKEQKHPIIKKDMEYLGNKVKELENAVARDEAEGEFDRLVPYRFLGDNEYSLNNYEAAIQYYEKAIKRNSRDTDSLEKIAMSYYFTEEFDNALRFADKYIEISPEGYLGYYIKAINETRKNRFDQAFSLYDIAERYAQSNERGLWSVYNAKSNDYLLMSNWKDALVCANNALASKKGDITSLINKSAALMELGEKGEAMKILEIEVLPDIKNQYYKACALSVLGNKTDMLKELRNAIKSDITLKVMAKYDPDFRKYWDDPAFIKIVGIRKK